MNIDEIASGSGEWLRGTGPDCDIVISTRLRLARNLATFPFTSRATLSQKQEIENLLKERLTNLPGGPELEYLSLSSLETLDKQLLLERQLISRELASAEGARGVAISKDESVSVMINEEDHLRIQVMRSGLDLDQAWAITNQVDDRIEQRVAYAFHEEFGYLTACPTNVGTGMRASVMLHLPALEFTRQGDQVFRALQKINLEVRGLYGEGSRASGHFYQISNQVTLGKSEETILREIQAVIPAVIRYEKEAREAWKQDQSVGLEGRVKRALETLHGATMMTSEETMELLSLVRLGFALGQLRGLSVPLLNELFIQTQPAHLQKLAGETLDSERRNMSRAEHLRRKLSSAQA
ncbi:MAG: protein arginine kinase [Planctomycetes bacterium]|jgi:protein arginine kinase|nr:protein arginine kinase [Planctomycetota bacterium]